MKVIKSAFPKRRRCSLCKSKFQYDLEDMKFAHNMCCEVYVVCPVCGSVEVVGHAIEERGRWSDKDT